MPLSKTGEKVMHSMVGQYGKKRGKEVFYASINARKKGSSRWHKKKKSSHKNYSSEHIAMAHKMMSS